MKQFLVTCDPGLEMVLEDELANIPDCTFEVFEPFRAKRLVFTHSEKPLFKLRSAHNISELLYRIPFPEKNITGLVKALKALEIPALETAASFRVTCKRWGNHPFTSMDVMREAGGVFWRKYGTKVDLHTYALDVRVDIFHSEIFIGFQHTRKSLAYRLKYAHVHKAPLKSTLAFGLLHLAKLKPGETVLDPFCGGGTLLIEAALAFGDKCKWMGSDLFEENVQWSRENSELNGVGDKINFLEADARNLEATYSEVDVIITDPPYGLKSGTNVGLPSLYGKFFLSAAQVLRSGGRLLVLSPKKLIMMQAIKETRAFKVLLEKRVETGQIKPILFVLERI